LTYSELAERSSRFASALASLGISRGERVFVLTGRIPELYIAVLGGLNLGAVVCTLFAAFGPEPIAQRLRLGDGRVLGTTPELYDRKVAASRAKLPDLRQVLLTGDPTECLQRPETGSLTTPLDQAAAEFPIAPTRAEDPALLHFTSGTTGKPKGAVHVHGAIVGHVATARLVLDLRAEDVYWCTADPGWVTGTSYSIVAPLVIGATSIVDEAEFDVHRWYRTIEEQQVTVWYTAPTAIRRLMRAGDQAAERYDLSSLRAVASVGEPLNPEAVVWGQRVLHRTIRDNWWQTETGAIAIANYGDAPVRPGSMGRPVPGMTAAVLVRGEDSPMTTRDIFDRSADLITPKRVFGDPYTSDGVTVIPAASIRGAGGGGEGKRDAEHGDGGGFAVNARPAGVVEITGDTVRWKVLFDLNRAITGTSSLSWPTSSCVGSLTAPRLEPPLRWPASRTHMPVADAPPGGSTRPTDGDPSGWTCEAGACRRSHHRRLIGPSASLHVCFQLKT
jgi:acyl-coenzyme A synthetase/AMP-(fatty) acid ligase